MSYPGPPGEPPPPGNSFPPQGYPGQRPPSPQPQWSPQQPPFDPSLPPKKRGNGWKWALAAVALLVVIGVTAAVTIWVTRDDPGGGGPTPTEETFGLASADDKGPVNIITEDPSCAAWRPINDTFDAVAKRGWNSRDENLPATRWTPEQRTQYDDVARTLRSAADQAVPLAKLTPHRVMREIYEQFIAYARAYSDAVPNYTPADDHLARVVTSTSSVLVYICAAIDYKSASARALLITAPSPPSSVAPLQDPRDPRMLMSDPDSTCADWYRVLDQFDADTKAWQALDSSIPASSWTTDQRAVVDAVVPVMKKEADDIEAVGRSSSNLVVQDLAVLAAQYRRAYAASLPTYSAADSYLSGVAGGTTSTVWEACKASEG